MTPIAAAFDTAKRLLREEADAHQASCAVGMLQWACEDCTSEVCPTLKRCNELRAAADALTELP